MRRLVFWVPHDGYLSHYHAGLSLAHSLADRMTTEVIKALEVLQFFQLGLIRSSLNKLWDVVRIVPSIFRRSRFLKFQVYSEFLNFWPECETKGS